MSRDYGIAPVREFNSSSYNPVSTITLTLPDNQLHVIEASRSEGMRECAGIARAAGHSSYEVVIDGEPPMTVKLLSV